MVLWRRGVVFDKRQGVFLSVGGGGVCIKRLCYSPQSMRVFDPPVEEDGHWVKRSDFTGNKSFGNFFCHNPGCKKKWWRSAHAFKDFCQKCSSCDVRCRAAYFWVNEHPKDFERGASATPDTDKEHLKHLCGACAAGVCTISRDCGQ